MLIQLEETVGLTSLNNVIQSYPSGTITHSQNYYGYRYSNGYEIKSSIGDSILSNDPFVWTVQNGSLHTCLFTTDDTSIGSG